MMMDRMKNVVSNVLKSSLYSPYYAEACNQWLDPSSLLLTWATQLRRNVAAVAITGEPLATLCLI